MEDISVVVPLGPNPCYLEWLPECLASILSQTYKPNLIVIVDDGANLTKSQLESYLGYDLIQVSDTYFLHSIDTEPCIILYKTPWNCGVAGAFNAGIGLAGNELVFMLGSDDKLMPTCLEECVKTWEAHNQKDGWYNVPIQLQSGDIVTVNNNAAMITRNLWKVLGGFPPSAGVAACDALLLSIMMVHMPDRIIQVESKEPLYWAREHEHQDTRHNMGYYAASGVVEIIRNMETLRWKPREGTLK